MVVPGEAISVWMYQSGHLSGGTGTSEQQSCIVAETERIWTAGAAFWRQTGGDQWQPVRTASVSVRQSAGIFAAFVQNSEKSIWEKRRCTYPAGNLQSVDQRRQDRYGCFWLVWEGCGKPSADHQSVWILYGLDRYGFRNGTAEGNIDVFLVPEQSGLRTQCLFICLSVETQGGIRRIVWTLRTAYRTVCHRSDSETAH